jgi:hypothetical protein
VPDLLEHLGLETRHVVAAAHRALETKRSQRPDLTGASRAAR